ncbi:capsular polysaccharide export protein, LipB/KpsS family [Bosea sp. NPDC055353]
MSHSYGVGELRPDTLLPESPWAQHLRGVAHCFTQTLVALNPAYVLVPNGAEVISAIIADVCSHNSVNFLYWESPFFSGHHFVDPYSPHFYRGLSLFDKSWPPTITEKRTLKKARAFVRRFMSERRSKYDQTSEIDDLTRLQNWITADTRPIVFIPQQVPTDANVVVNLGAYDDYEASLQAAIDSIPPDWRLLMKSHPKGGLRRLPRIRMQDSFDATGIAIHDILERVAVVATMSSNVGLEALLYDLPVAVWGQPIYSRKGCTTELSDPSRLGAYLSAPLPPLDPMKRDILVHHVLETGLVRHRNIDQLNERLGMATNIPRSFANFYPDRIRRISKAARALEAQLKIDPRLETALTKLDGADRDLIEAVAGPSLSKHSYGGAICSPKADIVEPNYRSLFSAKAAQELVRYRGNLQNHHAPDNLLRSLCDRCSTSTLVALEIRNPGVQGDYVQRLNADNIVSIISEIDPSIQVEVRGRAGRELTQSIDGASIAFILLRRRQGLLEPIISRLVSRRLRSVLRYERSYLEAALFSTKCQRSRDGATIWISGPINRGHVIYGPYRNLPAGNWRVQLLLSSNSEAAQTQWTFDAVLNGEIVSIVEWFCQDNKPPPAFEFDTETGGIIEFRIWCHSLGKGETFAFQGVELQDATS